MSKTRAKGMTVKQVIKLLEALPNKEIKLTIDCPYCGRGNQLAEIGERVVLTSIKEE